MSKAKFNNDPAAVVEMFNEQFPVGSKVLYRVEHDQSPHREVTVRYEAYVDKAGQPVAFFNELSGCYIVTENFVKYN